MTITPGAWAINSMAAGLATSRTWSERSAAGAADVSRFAAPAEGGRFIWKHERHSTGRPWVGLKGTVVSIPHAEHIVRVSVRE